MIEVTEKVRQKSLPRFFKVDLTQLSFYFNNVTELKDQGEKFSRQS